MKKVYLINIVDYIFGREILIILVPSTLSACHSAGFIDPLLSAIIG